MSALNFSRSQTLFGNAFNFAMQNITNEPNMSDEKNTLRSKGEGIPKWNLGTREIIYTCDGEPGTWEVKLEQ